jgi:hypothetical protein
VSAAKRTTDHTAIREWVDARGGHPARVTATAGGRSSSKKGSGGLLRIDFAEPDEQLERISWPEFFRIFDEQQLAFLYQDEKNSRFSKFIDRES